MSQSRETLVVDYTDSIAELEKQIAYMVDSGKTVGLSVALVDGNRLVWEKGFGFSREGQRAPVTPQTVFQLGSASQLFTIMGAFMLAQEKGIKLDTPVSKWFPELEIKSRFPGRRHFTLMELMTHHSGLPADVHFGKWRSDPRRLTALKVSNWLNTQYVVAPPSYVYLPSTPAIELLAEWMEKVQTAPFSEYMAKRVFKPLRMDSTTYRHDKIDLDRLSGFYGFSKDWVHFFARDVAAEGMYTSAHDLAVLFSAVLAGHGGADRPVPAEVLDVFKPQNQNVSLDLGTPFGMGWALGAFNLEATGPVAHFTGQSLFHQSQIIVLPTERLAVVILANTRESRELVDDVAQRVMAAALKTKTGFVQPLPTQLKTETRPERINLLEHSLIGRYATWRGIGSIYRKDNSLRMKMSSGEVFMLPRTGGFCTLQYRLFGLIPISVPQLERVRLKTAVVGGNKYLVSEYRGSDFVFGVPIEEQHINAVWKKRLGSYRVIEQDEILEVSDIKLVNQANILAIEYSLPPFIKDRVRYPVRIVSDTEAVIAGLGRSLGETIQFSNKSGRVQMRVDGYLAERSD